MGCPMGLGEQFRLTTTFRQLCAVGLWDFQMETTPHGRVRLESQRYQREIVKPGRFPCHQDLLNHGFLGSPFLSFPTDTRWGVQCIPVTGRCTWRCGVHPHRAKELDHPPNVWLTHGRHVSRGSSPTAYL